MVDESGKVVGHHEGLMYYTLGQRRGLGIGGGGNGQRWFVIEKDVKHNRLIVSQGEDDRLYTPRAEASEATWISGEAPGGEVECMVRLRHRQPLQKCRIQISGEKVHMEFDRPQRAVTPGQSAVFYQGDVCLGGAIVD